MLGQYIYPTDKEKQWEHTLNQVRSWYPNPQELREHFYQLVTLERSNILSSSRILIMCSSYIRNECLIKESIDPELQALTEYIESNYQSKITLDEISTALSISKTGLCNLAAKNNTTINTMIKKHRIQIAKELLNSTVYTISEIGIMIGIPDYNYFTKLFKSECGCTPSDFKKNTIEPQF